MKLPFFSSNNLGAPKGQGADFVELFFDLVFVYAITRITGFTAHHFDGKHIMQAVLIFWLIWWGWTQFTWTLNAANTRIPTVRLLVLIATGVAFIMASSVGEAFGDKALWFAVPYVIIRSIGIGLYAVVTYDKNNNRRTLAFAIPSVLGFLVVLAGALADPETRIWWWLAAIGVDMFAGYMGGRAEGWEIQPSHFAERHGLIVIIALGESLIVAGTAVSSAGISQEILMVGGLAVLITCLLWWSYFSWIFEFLEEKLAGKTIQQQGSIARDTFSFLHMPVIFGIIGIAIGFEKILGHPHDLISPEVAIALGGGYLLFIGFSAGSVLRISVKILWPRIIILILSVLGIALSINQPAQIPLIIISLSLLLILLLEWRTTRES